MDWIFDHVWVLVAIATVIGRLFMKFRGGNASQGDQPAPRKEFVFEDPELAERTRKIREEIQRRIAERRGQHLQPPVLPPQPRPAPLAEAPAPAAPPITLREVIREVMQPRPEPVPSSRQMTTAGMAVENERQVDLLKKLKEAEQMKAAAVRRAASEATTISREPAALPQVRAAVLEDLRAPQALRRAFVLREVLGPPVALR
jgi:type IV secretory pathway VirB10-like protein